MPRPEQVSAQRWTVHLLYIWCFFSLCLSHSVISLLQRLLAIMQSVQWCNLETSRTATSYFPHLEVGNTARGVWKLTKHRDIGSHFLTVHSLKNVLKPCRWTCKDSGREPANKIPGEGPGEWSLWVTEWVMVHVRNLISGSIRSWSSTT